MTQERNNTYAFVIEDPSKPKRQQLNFHLDQFKEYKESTHIQSSSTMDQSLASHHPHNPQHHSLHHVDHNPPPPPRPTLPSIKDLLIQPQPPLHQQHQQRVLHPPPPPPQYLHHHHQNNNILPQHKPDSLISTPRPHLPPLQPSIESSHNPNNFNYNRNERIDSHLSTISQHSHQSHTSPHSLHQQQHPLMPPSSDVSYYPPHSSYNTNNQYSINHKINQIPPPPQHQITSQGAQHTHFQQHPPPPQLPTHQQQRTPPHQVQTLPQQMQPSQRIPSHHQPSIRHHSHHPPSHSLQVSHHLPAQHQPQHQVQQLPPQQVPQAYHHPPPPLPSHHHSHMYNNDVALERSQHDHQTSTAPSRVPYNSHPYYSQPYSNNNSVPPIMASAPSHVTTSNVEYRDSTPSGPLLNNEQHYHQQQNHVPQYSQHSQHSQHSQLLQYPQAPQQQQQMYVPYQQHQPQQQQQQQQQQHQQQQQQQPQVPHLQSIHHPLTPPQLNLPPQQHSQQVQNQYLPENRETSPYLVPPPHHHSGNSGSNSSVSTRSSSPAPSTPIAPTNHPFSPNNNLVNNPVNNNIVDKPSTDSSVKKRGRSKHRHIAPAGPIPNQPSVPVSQSIPSNASNESLVFVQYSNSSTNNNAAPVKTPQASRSRKNSITGGSAPSTSKRGRKAKAIEDNVNVSLTPLMDNNEKNFAQSRKRDHSWLSSTDNQNKKKYKKGEEVHVIQDDDVVMDDNTHDSKEDESKINNMDIDPDVKLLLSLKNNNYDDTVNGVNGVNGDIENNEKPMVEDIKIKEEHTNIVTPVVEPVIEPVVSNIEIKSEKFDSIDEQFDQSVTTKVKEMSLSPTRKEEDKSSSEKKVAPRSPKPLKKPNDIVKSEVPEKNVLGINKVPNKKERTKMTVPVENDSDSDLAMDDGSEDEANKNKQSEQGWNDSDMETEEEVEEEIEISGTVTSSIAKEDENKRNINFPSSTLTSNNINNQNNQKSNGNVKDIKVTIGANSSNKKLSRPTSPISTCFTTTNNGTLSRKASTSSSISRKGSTSSNGSNKEKDNIICGSPTEASFSSPITSTLSSPLAKTMAADAGNSTTTSTNGNTSNTKPQRPCPPRRRSTMRDDEKLELNAIEWEKNIEIPHNIWEETLRVFEIVKHSKEMKNRQPHRKRNHILASILFILCRQNGLPRTFVEICNAASIRKQEIGTYYRLMLKVFESNGLSAGSNGTVDSAEYLKRWCQNLKLPPHILSAAIHVYRQASELNITTGKCPVSVGAASIWLSINSWNEIRMSNYSHTHPDDAELIKVEHKDVASAAGVVNATLVGCFKNLLKYKDKLLPEGFLKEARDRSPHLKPSLTSNGNNNNSENDTYGQMSSLDNVKYYGSPTADNCDNGKQAGETTAIESRVEPTSKPLKSETVIKSPTKLQVKTERSETNNQSLKSSAKEVETPTKIDPSIKKEVKNEKISTSSRSPPRITRPALEIEPGQEDADDELEEGELREDDEEMMMD